MIEKEVVAGRGVAALVLGANALLRISVEEQHAAFGAETPVALSGTGGVVIGHLISLQRAAEFGSDMRILGRNAESGASALGLASVEEQQVAIAAMSPVVLGGRSACRRDCRVHERRAADRQCEKTG